MKKTLLTLTTLVTTAAIAVSVYLATFESPTDIQVQLGNTANTIVIMGITTLVELLDDDQNDSGAT